jgi:hypothetical protein
MQAYLVTVAATTIFVFQVPWEGSKYSYPLLFLFGVIFPIGFTGSVLPMLSTVVLPEMRSTGFGLLASFFQGLSLTVVSAMIGFLADRIGLQRTLFFAVTLPYLANASLWFLLYRTYPADAAKMQGELDARRASPA